jgi:hypothetical protein
LAKRRREKRTSEPETAMAVAAASAPIEADDDEDMVVERLLEAGWQVADLTDSLELESPRWFR